MTEQKVMQTFVMESFILFWFVPLKYQNSTRNLNLFSSIHRADNILSKPAL